MQAAFLDWSSLNGDELDSSCLDALPLNWRYFPNIQRAQLEDCIDQFDIVISNKIILDAALLSAAKNLKLICVAATGTNNVDIQAAAERQIVVTNVRAYATESVVQHVFMLMLNLVRRFVPYQNDLANGRWQQSDYFCLLTHPIESLSGKTLGIIGFGELGQAVAKMAQCFGMKVMVAHSLLNESASSQAEARYAFDEILAQSDIISLHCPLSEQSKNLFNAETFGKMKNSALLINTARGGIVNERDLLTALDNNWIAGAAMDVLEREPPPDSNLLLSNPRQNLIITPHIAWATRQARQSLVEKLAQNIAAWLDRKVLNKVN